MKTSVKNKFTQTPKTPKYTNNKAKYDTLCVCQICTCGKDRCPKSKHIPFQANTTYHQDYRPCTAILNSSLKPTTNKPNEHHYNPELLKTTYNLQYLPYKVQKQTIDQNTKTSYKPKLGKFYDETQYKKSFIPKPMQLNAPKEPKYHTPKPRKFEGTTTYIQEFVAKTPENNCLPKDTEYTPRKLPFSGKTTYNTQFKNYPTEPTSISCCSGCGKSRCQCKPASYKAGKFQGLTNYNQSYQPYRTQRIEHCPLQDLPQRPRQCSPGKSHLNYSAQKNNWY